MEKWVAVWCLLLPLLGTSLGAAAVFCLPGGLRPGLRQLLLGMAAGVMTAASVWLLLLPALELAGPRLTWLPPSAGLLSGIGFLLLLDRLALRLRRKTADPEPGSMLLLAVTLHNVPEGMAVGVAAAGALAGLPGLTAQAALLALGIAVQNVPEGAIISMPMAGRGTPRGRAFLWGFLSGAVEPAAAALTLLVTALVSRALPVVLSFAAGAMLYVVMVELVPEAQPEPESRWGVVGAALGFVLMMLLDVCFG